MKKIFFAIITLISWAVSAMAQCPDPVTSTSNVTLTKRVAVVGMLKGRFTINSDGDQVSFSKGNLQYKAAPSPEWRFAENQWDIIGGYGSNNRSPYDVTSGNNSPSASQVGWIDLFGWATSGNPDSNPVGYQPYYTGSTNTDYGPSISSGDWNTDDSDWGVVNSGQLGAGWRTLTKAEWEYMLNLSNNAAQYRQGDRFAKATVHGVQGIIILPDGWTQAKSAMAGHLTTNQTSSYNHELTDENWEALESEGCVFLPAAGNRTSSDNKVYYATYNANYWTSTAYSTTQAYFFSVPNSSTMSFSNANRSTKYSVRLIHEL